jgi:putative aminopeptidase FrvX
MLDQELQTCAALLRCPTAPYFESQVRDTVEALLTGLPSLSLRRDAFGNLIAHYRHRPREGCAFAMVAHMDHPGFLVRSPRKIEFAGGVHEACFPGRPVVFFRKDSPAPVARAIIQKTAWDKRHKRVFFDRPIAAADFGMWDLPALRFGKKLVSARACDDLVGTATMAAVLRRLARAQARADVYALFTRAEEVGFHGALAHLLVRTRLPRIPVLSLETSNARGFARIGAGPILRVGDRTSIFDPGITAWLQHAFEKANPAIPHQRLLMGGGICEATALAYGGYATGALCVGLKNYHNMAPGNRIATEAVSLSDWNGLFRFLVFLATRAPSPVEAQKKRFQRLGRLQKEAQRLLKA